MLILEIRNLKKYFGERKLLEIDNLKIYNGDRIGLVGENGVGKSTLLKIIYGEGTEYSGNIIKNGKSSYLSQIDKAEKEIIDRKLANKFSIESTWKDHMSGGEKIKFKIVQVLSENPELLLLDEPTNNLDIESMDILKEELKKFKGSLLLVSHNRSFLNEFCNKVIELKGGSLKNYKGNYDDYIEKKDKEKNREQLEYEKYILEKNRLENASITVNEKSQSIRKAPKRMGNSEARLHKMGDQKAKSAIDKSSKSMQKRLERLEVKEKPEVDNIIKLGFENSGDVFSKILIDVKNFNIFYGDKKILENVNFQVRKDEKVAIMGKNGSGKTSMLRSIVERKIGIEISDKIKIGYFSQNIDIIDLEKNVLENVSEDSPYDESTIRTFLARLLFRGRDIFKKANVLSGGELVKLSLAKILLQDNNILILDEPTNNLDINSLLVIEEAIKGYMGTVLLVSHDDKLVENICSKLLIIEDKSILEFYGNYSDYKLKKNLKESKKDLERKLILENKISELISKISFSGDKEEIKNMDKEYSILMEELKELKEKP